MDLQSSNSRLNGRTYLIRSRTASNVDTILSSVFGMVFSAFWPGRIVTTSIIPKIAAIKVVDI